VETGKWHGDVSELNAAAAALGPQFNLLKRVKAVSVPLRRPLSTCSRVRICARLTRSTGDAGSVSAATSFL
jgi:hypothetical protein